MSSGDERKSLEKADGLPFLQDLSAFADVLLVGDQVLLFEAKELSQPRFQAFGRRSIYLRLGVTIGQKPASAGPASAGKPAGVPKINKPTPRHTPTMASTLVLWCGGYSPLSERSVFITVLVVVDHDSCQRQCRRFLAGRGPLSPRIGRHGDRYSDTGVSEIKTPRRAKEPRVHTNRSSNSASI